MKKKSFYIILSFLFLLSLFCGWNPAEKRAVFADASADTLNYVSLGDSIAEGYGLGGYAAKGETDFVADSYAYKFKNKLKGKYSNTSAVSYAKSGDTTADLLTKLNDAAVVEALSNADIMTICIGANDILGPATNNLIDFVLYNEDISGPLNAGLNTFSTNFVTILNKLYEINPTAKKIFTNVYNPYAELLSAENNLVINMGFMSQTITAAKFVEIGTLSEDYIAGNAAKGIVGLNQRMQGIINGEDAVGGGSLTVNNSNCYYIDTKAVFDAYDGSDRLINADILDYTELSVSLATAQSELMAHVDPHPTTLGHTYIYNAFSEYFDQNFVFATLNYNGGTLDNKISDVKLIKKGEKISEPLNKPTKSGYKCVGWTYLDQEQHKDFNFNTVINSDLTLYAKWLESCVISFNPVGGNSIEPQTLDAGQKVVEPQTPIKTGSTDVFAGWYYYDSQGQVAFWDFENNVVTKSLTLIAKWANSICLNTDLLMQQINNIQSVEFQIDIDADIQWYVNNNKQNGENGKTYIFTPPENAGEYRVYCVVNGVETKKHTVVISYIVPDSITAAISTISDKNLYTFSIENGNYIDGSKCVWYATIDQFTDEVEEIGFGTTCRTRVSKNCKVYVVYNGEIVSNYLEVDPPMVLGTNVYLIIGVTLVIAAFVVLLTIISRKRYKDYY